MTILVLLQENGQYFRPAMSVTNLSTLNPVNKVNKPTVTSLLRYCLLEGRVCSVKEIRNLNF